MSRHPVLPLFLTPAFDCSPAWSPDGAKLSFVTDRDGDSEVYIMDADGSNPTNVTQNPAEDFASSWTSDGTRLIFDTERDGNWEIYSILLDGTGLVRLTTHSADDEFPAWRP